MFLPPFPHGVPDVSAPFYRWKQSGECRSAANCERFRQQAFPRPARGADSSKVSGIVVLRTNYVQTVMDDYFNRFIAERRIRLLPEAQVFQAEADLSGHR
jgi:hypothetical protein